MKRLDDTAAITGNTPLSSHSVDVRKIDNGYVTRHSTYGDDGYECKEVFTPEHPTVETTASNPLRRAIDHVKR